MYAFHGMIPEFTEGAQPTTYETINSKGFRTSYTIWGEQPEDELMVARGSSLAKRQKKKREAEEVKKNEINPRAKKLPKV